ncbi:IPTL-CTERM sorting domain-containing protein [Diaphorobacter caeni]|uniref:IPTL-CTERM sorting domain-containing protein n=1 Tax=Diaphorobacter caeni TaxID=2784387 RepID=UPI00188E1BE4|nr:IPTL-CTERM sorting domain-containing protein [Diaphorobacter caeni]MBF5002652.1 IPTL-CTERM sorting domain-containing protein [Diaphorobacter caeni]
MQLHSLTHSTARRIRRILGVLATCLIPLAAGAQAPASHIPKILVLTTDEGRAGENFTLASTSGTLTGPFYNTDAEEASDNLARAFGNAGSGLVSGPPEVKYMYGALSIRPPQKDGQGNVVDKVASYAPTTLTRYSSTPTNLVRVLSAEHAQGSASTGAITQDEDVVYVPDTTPFLDPDNLAAIFKPDNGDRYDLVIVGSTYMKVTNQAYAALAKLMQDPALKPNAMLFFVDACCDDVANDRNAYSYNVKRLTDMVLAPATKVTGDPGAMVNGMTTGPAYGYVGGNQSMKLNSALNFPNDGNVSTLYAPGFQAKLPEIAGGDYQALINIPNENILYRVQDNNIADNRAYGMFFPSKQMFDGNGVCTFAVVDISPFAGTPNTTNTTSPRNIGQAFVDAALAGGACGGMASISAAPETQNVTLASPNATITLTVKNETPATAIAGAGTISEGRVEYTLPDHLQFTGTDVITTDCTLSGTAATRTNTDKSLTVKGISLPNLGSCTITLPVKWVDTTDPATNACINDTKHTATLTITPGVPNQFSTKEGQTNAQAIAKVVCTAPELQLTTNPTTLPGPFTAGSMVSYDVIVTNLSQTATAANAQLSALIPAGATHTITPKSRQQLLKANPVACPSHTDCTLAPGEVATFAVQFAAPANAASMAFSPTVALPANTPPNTEVTLANNTVLLAAPLQKQLHVQAQLTTAGSGDFTPLNGSGMAYAANGCNAAPASGSAPLGLDTAGAAQTSTADGTAHCAVVFSAAPGPLPTGYALASATPTLTDTTDPATGAQTVVATWTVLPPSAATIGGGITGGPSTFPTDLIGKTIDYELTCTPTAAAPSTGTLTVDSTGQLTTTNPPVIPAGSTCTLALKTDPSTLPLPSGYVWKSPVISGSGGSFTVTIPMARANGDSVPVPTLSEWALYALASLMLLAAAGQLRTRRAKR